MIEDVICKTVAILSRPQCYKFLHTKWFPLLQMGDFLNLDRIIQDWAWREYERTASKSQLKLLAKERRKPGTCLHPHIDWSEVKCTDVTTWPQVTEELFKASDSTDNNNRLFQRDDTHAASTVLFRTKFTNDTDDDQEYMMKTEKTTRSSCTIEVESGFTHGVAMSVGLKTPCEIFEANVGYCCEMTLTDTEGQTFEEEITWGVESLIKVKANHVADAQLVVNEKKYCGEFEIETKIRGPVYITFTNLRDNNSAIKMIANDITDILQRHVDMRRRVGEQMDHVVILNNHVIVRTKGKCQFRFAVQQEVLVCQAPIKVCHAPRTRLYDWTTVVQLMYYEMRICIKYVSFYISVLSHNVLCNHSSLLYICSFTAMAISAQVNRA